MHIYYSQVCRHRQLSYYPRGQTCPPSKDNHSGYTYKYITHERNIISIYKQCADRYQKICHNDTIPSILYLTYWWLTNDLF